MSYFSNKIVVVTGGASGMGLALCRELLKQQAKVSLLDINERKLQSAYQELVNISPHIDIYRINMAVAEDVKKTIDEIYRQHGRIDFLFNNAGVAKAGEIRDLSLDQWKAILDINLYGVIYGTIYAYEIFLKQGHGHLVNVSSAYGLFPMATQAPYVISKTGVFKLSECLRAEAMDFNIDVSVVCPGLVQTDIVNTNAVGVDAKDLVKLSNRQSITPEEAANIILAGVQKKKFLIAFPFYVKFLYWIYKLFPGYFFKKSRQRAQDFRKLRKL